jgi:HD-like signal output (HDOD) protein
VTTIASAVSYLGIETIRVLVLNLEIVRMFRGASEVRGFSVDALQRHALQTARLARAIAGEHAADDAYVAGMMHGLGRLVLAGRVPDRYGHAIEVARKEDRPLSEVEREVLGATHAEVGGYLLGLWGIPQRIVEAVTHHGEPARVDPARLGLAGAVYVASTLAADPDAPLLPIARASSTPTLDARYLEATGALASLAGWRALAKRAP